MHANNNMKKESRQRKWIIPTVIVVLIVCGFFIYVEQYYRADSIAAAALISDENVQISHTDYGWIFDGESEEDALIFYPGGKVEAAAYAPLCRELAQNGADVCLVEMPLRLAMFGMNKADSIIDALDYEHWYIAGHSLGGVFAAYYAAENEEKLDGIILLASYSTKELRDLKAILIYGSEDKVLNMKEYAKNRTNVTADSIEHIIDGGNHAQFGSYGLQAGDGTALVSPQEQIDETVMAVEGIFRESKQSRGNN